jgi:hypothetical protein
MPWPTSPRAGGEAHQRRSGSRGQSPPTAAPVPQRLRTFIARADARYLLALNDLVDHGAVTPFLARAYALPDAARPIRDLEAGHSGGRLVLTT